MLTIAVTTLSLVTKPSHWLVLNSAPAIPITMQAASTTEAPASSANWLDLWYPVCFAQNVPATKLVAATIFERPLVLFRDAEGAVNCLSDQCPHRLAPLSDGRLTADAETGRTVVECSYHGWQFGGCGRCTKLPQLDISKPILPLYDATAYPITESQVRAVP